jgi:hypothetical protein
MGVCLYSREGATFAPMAIGGTPPQSQLSWLSHRHHYNIIIS